MNSNDDSPIDFYNKVFDSYKSEDYFDETTITINYTKNIVSTDKSERLYKIDSLSLESSQSDNSNDNLKKFINTCIKNYFSFLLVLEEGVIILEDNRITTL